MADITVDRVGPREFEVRVEDSGSTTNHRVTVPEGFESKVGVSDDLERIVRGSFVFLLEREPASSIMPEFSLDVISGYFPEYEEELPNRL